MLSAVNPEMLQLARHSRDLTQKQLAEITGITQGYLSKFEMGVADVPESQVRKIARALDYPVTFFWEPGAIEGPGISNAFHRRRKTLPVNRLKQIQAAANILMLHIRRLRDGIEISVKNQFRAYDIEEFSCAADVAQAVRAEWRLPIGPVKNMVGLIEAAGGIVVKRDFGPSKFDAQSQWIDGEVPLFLVNSATSADRLRFTLAHEIGHIVMHHAAVTPDIELEADMFASEFLMPKHDILPDLPPVSLHRVMNELKPKWKVSMAALIRRAHDLGVISHAQYRRFFSQLGALGYRTREPMPLPDENPVLLDKIIDAYQTEAGYTVEDMSRLLRIYPHEFRTQYLAQPSLKYT